MTVSVEIERTDSTKHPNQMKEIQTLNLFPNTTLETTRITINNVGEGQFALAFVDHDGTLVKTDLIDLNTTDSDMRSKINPYYWQRRRSACTVTKTMYDSNDVITTNETEGIKHVYEVTVKKLLDTQSVKNIMSSDNRVTFDLPSAAGTLSSAPLSGNLRIKCVDSNNLISYSYDFKYSSGTNSI